jgi:hypothetical protein
MNRFPQFGIARHPSSLSPAKEIRLNIPKAPVANARADVFERLPLEAGTELSQDAPTHA